MHHDSDIKQDICRVNIPASMAPQSTRKERHKQIPNVGGNSPRPSLEFQSAMTEWRVPYWWVCFTWEQPPLKKSAPFIHSSEADVLAHVMWKKGKQQKCNYFDTFFLKRLLFLLNAKWFTLPLWKGVHCPWSLNCEHFEDSVPATMASY